MGGLVPAWKCSACPTAGPRPPPAPAGPWVEERKQPLLREEELGLVQEKGAALEPCALQPARGLECPKAAERWWQGDRFSWFWKKQVSAAMLEASETSHLLPPSAFPILTLKTPTWKLPPPCMPVSFLHGPQAVEMAVMASASHPQDLYWWRCSSKACAPASPVPDTQLPLYFFIQNVLWNVLRLTWKDNPPIRSWVLRWLQNRSQLCCFTTKCLLISTCGQKNPHLMRTLWYPYLRFMISLTTPFSKWKLLGLGGDAIHKSVAVTRQL